MCFTILNIISWLTLACFFNLSHRTFLYQLKTKNPAFRPGLFTLLYSFRFALLNKSSAVTYSHMGTPHTTIGITAFHFWVRYGVRWDHRIIAAEIILYILYFIFYILYFTFYILYFIFYILYFIFFIILSLPLTTTLHKPNPSSFAFRFFSFRFPSTL